MIAGPGECTARRTRREIRRPSTSPASSTPEHLHTENSGAKEGASRIDSESLFRVNQSQAEGITTDRMAEKPQKASSATTAAPAPCSPMPGRSLRPPVPIDRGCVRTVDIAAAESGGPRSLARLKRAGPKNRAAARRQRRVTYLHRRPSRRPITACTQPSRTSRLAGRDIGRSNCRGEPASDRGAPRHCRPSRVRPRCR
jgi:hypothetical protein